MRNADSSWNYVTADVVSILHSILLRKYNYLNVGTDLNLNVGLNLI